ncbi:MAG: GntR family transcriptional regulator [Deltaproteobacteria bacterium]|nr:GntR family transcriptional regulator [Deltaproteobacteria bacterium]
MSIHGEAKEQKNSDSTLIYEVLKEMIVSHTLLPSQRLIEQELSKKFNVSRTPLREALRRLEAEGFVTYTKNRGVFVSYLSPKDVEERFIYFSNLLAFASSLSVEHLTSNQINELIEYDDKMRHTTSMSDRVQWVAYNQSFHVTLVSGCPNKYILSQLTKEGERLWRYWVKAFNLVFDLEVYHQEHREIIEKVVKGDKKGVYDIVYLHTSRFSDKIMLISKDII